MLTEAFGSVPCTIVGQPGTHEWCSRSGHTGVTGGLTQALRVNPEPITCWAHPRARSASSFGTILETQNAVGLWRVGMTEPSSGFAHLHARSWYSFRLGASSPDALVAQALENGDEAVAVTDYMSVAGCIPLQAAARAAGIRAVIGAEVNLEGFPLVMLAASNAGYATINRLISRGFEQPEECISLDDLRDDHSDVFILTGGREGKLRSLLEAGQPHTALEWVKALADLAPKRVFIEVSSHGREGESRMISKLLSLSRTARLPAVVTNDVRYATPFDAARYDALILSRQRLTVHDDHPERIWSRDAWLKPRVELEKLIHGEKLYANALEIARACQVELIPGKIEAPRANLALGVDANTELEALTRAGIKHRYAPHKRPQALGLMERELGIIKELGLARVFSGRARGGRGGSSLEDPHGRTGQCRLEHRGLRAGHRPRRPTAIQVALRAVSQPWTLCQRTRSSGH